MDRRVIALSRSMLMLGHLLYIRRMGYIIYPSRFLLRVFRTVIVMVLLVRTLAMDKGIGMVMGMGMTMTLEDTRLQVLLRLGLGCTPHGRYTPLRL